VLDLRVVLWLMLCPPCVAFCVLQLLWNFKRMGPERVAAVLREGRNHLRFAMACARHQLSRNRRFVFEHPTGASSWKDPEVLEIAADPTVTKVTFDQCMFGLLTVNGNPARKRNFLTNCPKVVARFKGCLCDKSHDHEILMGADGGKKLTRAAQRYPPKLVEALAECAL